MSQKTEPKFLIIGAASSLIIALVCSRTLCMKGLKSGRLYYLTASDPLRLISYFFWLLLQIIKSAVYVASVVLSDRSKIDPSVVYFRADYDSPFARAALANSITLTPGTITIDITEDGIYSVHTLTEELREGLLDGSMQGRVARAFGEHIEYTAVGSEEIPAVLRPADENYEPRVYRARRKSK